MTLHITNYGRGLPVVFFHGWGFDSHIWRPLIPYLKDRYHLFFVDLPGFGYSPMMEWDVFKKQLIEHLPASFTVVGWSLGGLFATRFAIEEPERIDRLINIASVPRFITAPDWPGVAQEVFINFHDKLSKSVQSTLNEFIALQLHHQNIEYSIGQLPSLDGLHSGLSILDTWDLREGLHSFSKPACFMFGRLDPITPARLMDTMQQLYPCADYILFRKAAHMPFLSEPEVFVAHLSEFIQ